MRYKVLKRSIKIAIKNWKKHRWCKVKEMFYPTPYYWDEKQIYKANKRFKKFTIRFVKTDNPVFPNRIRIIKK